MGLFEYGDEWNFTVGGGGINPNSARSVVQENEQSNTDLNINQKQIFKGGTKMGLNPVLPPRSVNPNNPVRYINGVPLYSLDSDVARAEGFIPDVTLQIRVCLAVRAEYVWRTPNNFYIDNGSSPCPNGQIPSNWEKIEPYEFDKIRVLRSPNATPIQDFNSGAVDTLIETINDQSEVITQRGTELLEDLNENVPNSIFNNQPTNPVMVNNQPVTNPTGINSLQKSDTFKFLGEKIILPLIIGIGTLYLFQKYSK